MTQKELTRQSDRSGFGSALWSSGTISMAWSEGVGRVDAARHACDVVCRRGCGRGVAGAIVAVVVTNSDDGPAMPGYRLTSEQLTVVRVFDDGNPQVTTTSLRR
jgi:hypothetical protein